MALSLSQGLIYTIWDSCKVVLIELEPEGCPRVRQLWPYEGFHYLI